MLSVLRDRLVLTLPHVAVVRLSGSIGTRIDPARYTRFLTSLARTPTTRAVVLEWDSPGGGVAASEQLTSAVRDLAAERPVVSHVAGVAASGAYMAAIAAPKVVAQPLSIVGSIGVLSLRPRLAELLDRIGVGVEVTKSGPLKDMGAVYRDATPEEKAKEEALVGELFDAFVSWVAAARDLPEERVRELATGEVFTGRRAAELGLVDEVGDRRRAVALAAEMARVPVRPLEMSPRRSLLEQLNPAAAAAELATALGAAFARGIAAELDSLTAPRYR